MNTDGIRRAAWLSRLRDGNGEMSPFAARQIAGQIDEFLKAVEGATEGDADDLTKRAARDDSFTATVRQYNEADGYARRLFKHYAPQCEPMPTLPGVLSQLDNLIAGFASRNMVPAEFFEIPGVVAGPVAARRRQEIREDLDARGETPEHRIADLEARLARAEQRAKNAEHQTEQVMQGNNAWRDAAAQAERDRDAARRDNLPIKKKLSETLDQLAVAQDRIRLKTEKILELQAAIRNDKAVKEAREGCHVRADLLESAWAIIANAGGGNWQLESPEWQNAAARFRDEYFRKLGTGREDHKPKLPPLDFIGKNWSGPPVDIRAAVKATAEQFKYAVGYDPGPAIREIWELPDKPDPRRPFSGIVPGVGEFQDGVLIRGWMG